MSTATAAILIIGNEILSGKVTDVNSTWLAGELRRLGVELRRVEVIPDDVNDIGEAVARLSRTYTYLFTSGGVGPTHDDLTIEGIAAGLGREVYRHPLLEQTIRDYYGEPVDEAHLRMALVPRGAEVVAGPGIPIPVVTVDNITILPGIPKLFKLEFESICARFAQDPFISRRVFVRRGEVEIVDLLYQVAQGHPGVDIGSYPHLDPQLPYQVMVTLDSKDAKATNAALEDLLSLLGSQHVHEVQ
jgi:molybdenum cofactor synthesis domain-containing protein